MRSKEQAHTTALFPEPDLPPLLVTGSGRLFLRAHARAAEARRKRMVAEYQIAMQDAHAMTARASLPISSR